jgi:uncharacterized protein
VSFVIRVILLFVLAMLVARAFWRLVAGIIVGASMPPPSRAPRRGPPERGVQMVRDPVCGTFLPPGTALTMVERGGATQYFCSEACRERFRRQSSSRR